ncbi:hypothetical protein E143388_07338 [Rhodococcus opacus]|nr:hypothetical protein E143388_07338 [Rhodococcus opacus]
MGGGGEGGAVADLDQDPGCCPDSDAGRRGQDSGKRVIIEGPLHVLGDRFPLLESLFQGVGVFGEDGLGGRGAGHDHGLLVEGGKDVGGQPGAHSGCVLDRDRGELSSIRGEHPARSGNKKLKRALFLSAFSALHDPTSRAYYDKKRAEKKKHNAALICLARRRCDVLYAMLKNKELYRAPLPSAA